MAHDAANVITGGSPPIREINIGLILKRWKLAWRIHVAAVAACVALVIVVDWIVTPQYRIEATIAPVIDTSGVRAASKKYLVGGEILGGLSSLASPFGSAHDPIFSRYLFELTSERVAERLAQRHPEVMHQLFNSQWDEQSRQWRAPSGPVGALSGAVRTLLRLPPWHPPEAHDLAKLLSDKLVVSTDLSTSITTVSIDNRDPEFGRKLLNLVLVEAENVMREDARDTLEKQVAYVVSVLPTVTNSDARTALAGILSDTEKMSIMVEPDIPFAASVLDPPSYSRTPVFPQPLVFLAVALVAGLLIGSVIMVRSNRLTGRRRNSA